MSVKKLGRLFQPKSSTVSAGSGAPFRWIQLVTVDGHQNPRLSDQSRISGMIHAQVSPFHCGTNRVTGWPLMGSRSCARSKTARPIHFTAGSSGAILRVTALSRYVSADPGTGRPRPRDQSCPPSLASISRGSMWPSTSYLIRESLTPTYDANY